MKRTLVIGATGNVGRQVISQLIATNVRVRALTRNPDSANLPAQVEIVRGDLTIPDTAANALLWWAPTIRAGNVVRWPYAEAPTAPIHERDIAAVAVRMLCEESHSGEDYVLTGPQSLSQSEQVSIIGEVIGRTLRFEEISPEEARRELLTVMPPPVIRMLLNAWAAAIGQPAFVTSAVADITGTPARTFRDWVIDHAAEFRR
jgi:uncharacterized protein YbjT (DUF2867 family)